MLGLIGAVYLLLAYMSMRERNLPQATIPTVVAVAVVVGVWVFAPAFLAVGSVRVPLAVRQAGLGVGGLAIVARYIAVRRGPKARYRSPTRAKSTTVLGALATPLLGVCLAAASANWLVATAAAVLVGTDLVRRAAASAGEGSATSPPPPDTE